MKKLQIPSLASLTLCSILFAAAVVGHAEIVYVSNWNGRTIEKYDSVTGSKLDTYSVGGPQGLALDAAGNLFAVEWTTQSILKFTPSGVRSVFATGLIGPKGLAFDSAGNLYVGNVNNNTIVRFTPGGVG